MTTLVIVVAVLVPSLLIAGLVTYLVLSVRRTIRSMSTIIDPAALPPGPALAWSPMAPDRSLLARFTGGPLQQRVMQGFRKVRAAMWTRYRGYSAVAFTYTYRKISLLYRSYYVEAYGIVSLDLPAQVPMLHITRTGLPAPAGERVATGDAAFDATFQVVTTDAGFARAFLGPAARQALLRDPRAALFPFRSERSTLSTWVYDSITGFDDGTALIRPQLVDPAVDFLALVADHLPRR